VRLSGEVEKLREEVAVGEQHDCDAVDMIHAADIERDQLRARIVELEQKYQEACDLIVKQTESSIDKSTLLTEYEKDLDAKDERIATLEKDAARWQLARRGNRPLWLQADGVMMPGPRFVENAEADACADLAIAALNPHASGTAMGREG
jgi:chromosome segregation ATPase